MDDPITFEVSPEGGEFHHPDDNEIALEALYAAQDRRDAGRLTPARYVAALKSIVERHPAFIDGYAHIGYALLEQDKPKLALRACLRGFELGESAIPPDFTGPIEWGWLENRPFLRAALGVVLCHQRLGQRDKTVAVMERMLGWNPNDNQGLRYLIGSEYLRAGRLDEARDTFETEAGEYPPYHYELGLLHIRKGDFVNAATSLRRGFAANLYIAEILCGVADPMPHPIWHDSNFAEPDVARSYLGQCGGLWRQTRGAIAFVHWLYEHPKILIERASVLEWQEALLWEQDHQRRGELLAKREAARARIDGSLSEELVRDRVDARRRATVPWLHGRGR